jgi:hypothetical protein
MTLKATNESTGGTLSLIESLAAPGMATRWHVHHREDELMMRSLHMQMSVKYNPISFKLTTLFRTIAERFQYDKRMLA